MRNRCDVTGVEFEGQGVYMKGKSGRRYYVSQATYTLFLFGLTLEEIRSKATDLEHRMKNEDDFFKGAWVDTKPAAPVMSPKGDAL